MKYVIFGLLIIPSMVYANDAEWLRRSTMPNVVKSEGFDSLVNWRKGNIENYNCISGYECRANAWDSSVKSSGTGSLRFDILSNTGGAAAGSSYQYFSDDKKLLFRGDKPGLNEVWVSWRQKMDPYFIDHYYQVQSGKYGSWKQIILGDGSPASCSTNEIVVQHIAHLKAPSVYHACGYYTPFYDSAGSSLWTYQNQFKDAAGNSTCKWDINFNYTDQSGCRLYKANLWSTYTLRVKMNSNHSKFDFEIYMAYEGKPYELIHKDSNLTLHDSSDENIRGFGKVVLTPFHTAKTSAETHQKASTWYDELIVSKSCIPAPGHGCPDGSNKPGNVDAKSPMAPTNVRAN